MSEDIRPTTREEAALRLVANEPRVAAETIMEIDRLLAGLAGARMRADRLERERDELRDALAAIRSEVERLLATQAEQAEPAPPRPAPDGEELERLGRIAWEAYVPMERRPMKIQWHELSEAMRRRYRDEAAAVLAAARPGVTEDNIRLTLEHHGLWDEFGKWGCDAVDSLCDALLVARRDLAACCPHPAVPESRLKEGDIAAVRKLVDESLAASDTMLPLHWTEAEKIDRVLVELERRIATPGTARPAAIVRWGRPGEGKRHFAAFARFEDADAFADARIREECEAALHSSLSWAWHPAGETAKEGAGS